MHILRTVGATAAGAAILLSSGVAFAEERSGKAERGDDGVRAVAAVASTTRVDDDDRDKEEDRVKGQDRAKEMREKAAKRLAEVQDKVKQKLAQKIADQLERLNTTWTNHFTKLLDRYDAILKKVEDRAAIAAGKGKDVSAVNTAVQSAKTSLATARAAVAVQAAKTYVLDTSALATTTATTTPSGQEELLKGLRASFKNLHNTLFTDLFALRDGAMKNARKAVQDAHQALGKVRGVDDDDEETATSTKNSNQ